MRRKLPFCIPVSWSWETVEAMWVNNLPKVQWNSGAIWESSRGPRVRIPNALTTEPLSHTVCVCLCRLAPARQKSKKQWCDIDWWMLSVVRRHSSVARRRSACVISDVNRTNDDDFPVPFTGAANWLPCTLLIDAMIDTDVAKTVYNKTSNTSRRVSNTRRISETSRGPKSLVLIQTRSLL